MTGMNDDKTPKPPKQGSWGAGDRRMLLITIAGGLAANIGTVLIVGLALAYLHWLRSGPPPHQVLLLSLAGIVISVAGSGVLIVLAKYGPQVWGEGNAVRFTLWWVTALVALLMFVSLLLLVGDAAGVK